MSLLLEQVVLVYALPLKPEKQDYALQSSVNHYLVRPTRLWPKVAQLVALVLLRAAATAGGAASTMRA